MKQTLTSKKEDPLCSIRISITVVINNTVFNIANDYSPDSLYLRVSCSTLLLGIIQDSTRFMETRHGMYSA